MIASSDAVHRDRCPVCDSLASLTIDVLACRQCGARFRQLPTGVLGAFEAFASVEYPDDGAELTAQVEDVSFWFRHRNAVLSTLLDRHPPAGTLWDIGGGNGFQALCFQQQGRPVVLVEPGEIGCRNAQRRGVRTIVQATLESLSLPSGLVAACSVFDVLEHLVDPARVLAECVRVLRPGGRLYVTVPAHPWLWSDEDRYAQHQRRYTPAGLEQELKGNGFSLEYLGYYFQFLVVPILLMRALPYRLTAWRRSGLKPPMDQGEHAPGGVLQRLLEASLAKELAAIQRGATLHFGSSLLAVAVKS
jgi:ubiquinone/menaquinone biosynthesis C-methylase UbiE